MYAIEAEQVSKRYRNGVQALSDFQLFMETGEIVSLLGPNGAGKSTLIHILTTRLRPDSGRIHILGNDLLRDAKAVRAKIACAAQQPSLDAHLSLEENMMLQGRLYGISGNEAKKKIEQLIQEFSLDAYRNLPVAAYSGGVRRRLDLALQLMSDPKLLFLDEPTVGMDVESRRAMWSMVRRLREERGVTILLSTHYLEEAESLSDRVCIMDRGTELVTASLPELRSLFGPASSRQHSGAAEPSLEEIFLKLTQKRKEEAQ